MSVLKNSVSAAASAYISAGFTHRARLLVECKCMNNRTLLMRLLTPFALMAARIGDMRTKAAMKLRPPSPLLMRMRRSDPAYEVQADAKVQHPREKWTEKSAYLFGGICPRFSPGQRTGGLRRCFP